MEDLLDYYVDPLEGVPIWTEPRTTPQGFYTFDNKLSEEIDALPSITSSRIMSISLPEDALTNPDYVTQ